MSSFGTWLFGLLGIAAVAFARTAFTNATQFNRVRGGALTAISSALSLYAAWMAAVAAASATVDTYSQSLSPGAWVDWLSLIDAVGGSSTPGWIFAAAASAAILLNGLSLVACARDAVGCQRPPQ